MTLKEIKFILKSQTRFGKQELLRKLLNEYKIRIKTTMSNVPNFVSVGEDGSKLIGTSGNYLSLENGKPKQIYLMHGLKPPTGEIANGKNAVLSYMNNEIYDNDKRYSLPEGVKAVTFPKISNDPNECGALLGLTPVFNGLAIVGIENDPEGKEYVWRFKTSVYKQLLEAQEALGRDLKGAILRVTKTGEKQQTKYTVMTTGRFVTVDGVPETDLVDHLGNLTTREKIVNRLIELEIWDRDPMPEVKTKKETPKTKATPAIEIEDEEPEMTPA